MATIEINKKTLEVIIEGSKDGPIVSEIKSSLTGKKPLQPRRELFDLGKYESVTLDRLTTNLTLKGLIDKGFGSKYVWIITLHNPLGASRTVIASRDEPVTTEAYEQIRAALRSETPIIWSTHIENSTIVSGIEGSTINTGYVGRDANNQVNSKGQPPKSPDS